MQIRIYILGLFTIMSLLGCGSEQGYILVNPKLKYTDKECMSTTFSHRKIDKREKIDKIVIHKSKRMLYTYRAGKIVNSFRISLGKNGDKGHKERLGDNKTPEGAYSVAYKQYSKNYYKSLKISYPNEKDKTIAKSKGLNPGGYIMIHGQPRWNAKGMADDYMLNTDWTAGCIALTNSSMDKLYYAVENGIPIEIKS